ncbi:type III PLP-dependent enzyme [Streptomyces catenulae]|uniref:Type III PLP-dependent enzyme n=1 Tax=Streptomyces catenulae TaxID=66875 RepID=A0ABV2YZG8_9ACTN|nr:type III PLP-dependent enzyme [Streptomyces catenulae]
MPETPAYVYDLAAVRHAHGLLRDSLPESAGLFYSLKANPHPAVLRQLSALGCRAEVSSPGELTAALEAGFRAGDILYTGPGRRDADVGLAVARGVRHFSVDSPHALDQLDHVGRVRGVPLSALLRINPPEPPAGVGLAMTGGPSQFGADLAWVLAEPRLFHGREHVATTGIHLYMGSNQHDGAKLLATFAYGLDIVAEVEARLGFRLATVDLGGGFGAPYAVEGDLPRFPALRAELTSLLAQRLPGSPADGRTVVFESGRYLTAGCGRLLTRVLDVKVSQGRRVVVLDAGVNHLAGMAGLGKEPFLDPDFRFPRAPGGHRSAKGGDDIVSGPLCHPLDLWTRTGSLPELRIGDLLTVPNVGAYGLHSSLTGFHCHPMPLEVVVDGDREAGRSRELTVRERGAS